MEKNECHHLGVEANDYYEGHETSLTESTQDDAGMDDFFRQHSDWASDVSRNMNTNDASITCDVQPQCQALGHETSSSGWQYIADLIPDESLSSIPLEQWVEVERRRSTSMHRKESILRKLTVAYGICKLLESPGVDIDHCNMSNFAVREHNEESNAETASIPDLVAEVFMIHPSQSVQLSAAQKQPPSGSAGRDSTEDYTKGLDVQFTTIGNFSDSSGDQQRDASRNERGLCYALGELILYFFSTQRNFADGKPIIRSSDKTTYDDALEASFVQPAKKQSSETSFSQASISVPRSIGANDINGQRKSPPLKPPSLTQFECDCVPSISRLIGDLLSCGDELFCSDSAFKCTKDVADELHLILKEPNSFLFERTFATRKGKHILTFSKERLVGRSIEISDITNAYHRVASSGRSECVIVGGDSG